ncbi:MAG: hypothetical protein LUE29_00225 [Lachnospiraceae bacterium]|nr:hypothetical protein [Lachnospiraceae bacterium]
MRKFKPQKSRCPAFLVLFLLLSACLCGCAAAGDDTVIEATSDTETQEGEATETWPKEVVLTDEEAEQDYLSKDVLVQAVTDMLAEIYPNLEARYDLKNCLISAEDESELGYSLWYYEAIEQIGIRPAMVSNHIQAGKMSEDSYNYKELYETRDYGFGNTAGYYLAKIYVTEDGIGGLLASGNTYELYEEWAAVVDINEILGKVVGAFRLLNKETTVTEIMLTMAETPVQDEDGKYRIIYAPYWVVSYSCEQNGTEMSTQLVYDAYTGEMVYP